MLETRVMKSQTHLGSNALMREIGNIINTTQARFDALYYCLGSSLYCLCLFQLIFQIY